MIIFYIIALFFMKSLFVPCGLINGLQLMKHVLRSLKVNIWDIQGFHPKAALRLYKSLSFVHNTVQRFGITCHKSSIQYSQMTTLIFQWPLLLLGGRTSHYLSVFNTSIYYVVYSLGIDSFIRLCHDFIVRTTPLIQKAKYSSWR